MRFSSAARSLGLAALVAAFATASVPALAQPGAAAKPAAKPAPAKPGGKPAPKVPAKPAPKAGGKKTPPPKGGKVATRKAGDPGEPDENARRVIAGVPSTPGRSTDESPELRAMRELDLALFSPAPDAGPPWPADDLPRLDRDDPVLLASGMPPPGELAPAKAPADAPQDLSWIRKLDLPDIPVRWDARVIRYLEFYKNTPRGRAMVASWIKKSGRYGGAIRRVLREQGLPEDILWLSLVESGFDATIHSPAGAAGLWQFMPEGARIYGLTVDRWIDERLDPERATLAAARYLSDLHKRFGSWELAFAAYNMGYGGLLAAIRKYNTNDFWELSRLEAGMPLETALYVPKIVSMAIVARNCAVFGCDGVELEPAVTFDKVTVGSGVALRSVAVAAGVEEAQVAALNPQLPAGRTPPQALDAKDPVTWTVRVPPGAGPRAAKSLGKQLEGEEKLTRYLVRWGESIEDIANARRTSKSTILSLNGLRRDEPVRPGTLLLLPAAPGIGAAAADLVASRPSNEKPVVVVPAEAFNYPDRRRVFYRVTPGDVAREVAPALGVTLAELCRWNALDTGAALHDGMVLQVFVPKEARLSNALVLEEGDARVLPVGSNEFFTYFEGLKGRKRIEVVAAEGDTWRTFARRYNVSLGTLERINHRSRTSPIAAGDKVVVYVPMGSSPASRPPVEDKGEPAVVHPVEDHPPPTEEIASRPDDDRKDDDKDNVTRPASLHSEADDPDGDDAPVSKAEEKKPKAEEKKPKAGEKAPEKPAGKGA
jgi:membrane-bound lytic murein transglycosylase D